MPTFTAHGLQTLTHLIATRMGSEKIEADEVADHLVRANLAGARRRAHEMRYPTAL